MRFKTFARALSLAASLIVAMAAGAAPAMAESHPVIERNYLGPAGLARQG